jgi:hypothetical protein
MKMIPLTQGKFAQVDDWNYDRLNQFKWCTARHKKRFYAVTRICGQNIYMHHVVMNTGFRLDHEDGDGLNNQEHNIREATHQQNCQNAQGKNGIKGVYKDGKRYVAKIQVEGKKIHIGSFRTKVEAAAAYNEAALEGFGQFAWLNNLGEIAVRNDEDFWPSQATAPTPKPGG